MAKFQLRVLVSGLAGLVPHAREPGIVAVLFPAVHGGHHAHGVPPHEPAMGLRAVNLKKIHPPGALVPAGDGGWPGVVGFDLSGLQVAIASADPRGEFLHQEMLGDLDGVDPRVLNGSNRGVAARAFLQYRNARAVEPIRQQAVPGGRQAGSFVFARRDSNGARGCRGSRLLAGAVEYYAECDTEQPAIRVRKIGSPEAVDLFLEPAPGESVVDVILTNPAIGQQNPAWDADEHYVAYHELLPGPPAMGARRIPKRCDWIRHGLEVFDSLSYFAGNLNGGSPAADSAPEAPEEPPLAVAATVPLHWSLSASAAGPPLCSKGRYLEAEFAWDPRP